ncbi:hypothetical protein EXS72_01125 [Candidatus Pacearchaeota archaeon]|nr:hypothetical protein [Candidatus Pacearchaeota archaeon]
MENLQPYIPLFIGESRGLAYKFDEKTEIKIGYDSVPRGYKIDQCPEERVLMPLFLGAIPENFENHEIFVRCLNTQKRIALKERELVDEYLSFLKKFILNNGTDWQTKKELQERYDLFRKALYSPNHDGLVEALIKPEVGRKFAIGLNMINVKLKKPFRRILLINKPITEIYCLPPSELERK